MLELAAPDTPPVAGAVVLGVTGIPDLLCAPSPIRFAGVLGLTGGVCDCGVVCEVAATDNTNPKLTRKNRLRIASAPNIRKELNFTFELGQTHQTTLSRSTFWAKLGAARRYQRLNNALKMLGLASGLNQNGSGRERLIQLDAHIEHRRTKLGIQVLTFMSGLKAWCAQSLGALTWEHSKVR